jgi:hypothetical protein
VQGEGRAVRVRARDEDLVLLAVRLVVQRELEVAALRVEGHRVALRQGPLSACPPRQRASKSPTETPPKVSERGRTATKVSERACRERRAQAGPLTSSPPSPSSAVAQIADSLYSGMGSCVGPSTGCQATYRPPTGGAASKQALPRGTAA